MNRRAPSSAPAQMTFTFPTDPSPNPRTTAPPKSPMRAYSRPTSSRGPAGGPSTRAPRIQTLQPLIDMSRIKTTPRYPGEPKKKIIPPPALNLNFNDDIKTSKSPHASLSKQEVSSAGSASSDFSLPNDQRETSSSLYCETPSPKLTAQTPTTPITPSKAFTRPCKYFQQGFCVKGAHCTFLHSTQEVPLAVTTTTPTAESPAASAVDVDPNKLFIRLCRYYVKGQCTKGKECTFIHPTDEQLNAIRVKSSELPINHPDHLEVITPEVEAQSPRLCLNVNATSTSLTLGNPEKPQSVKATKMFTKVCKFFQLGQCLKGDQCTFIHEKLAPERQLATLIPERPIKEIRPSPRLLPSKEFHFALDNGIPNASDSSNSSAEQRTTIPKISSPRFARVDNRTYKYHEIEDVEDFLMGKREAGKALNTHSNVVGVLTTLEKEYQFRVHQMLGEIHSQVFSLRPESVEKDKYEVFQSLHSVGCTGKKPEAVAEDIRRSNIDFDRKADTLSQPRFSSILKWLKEKGIIAPNAVYVYQVWLKVSAKYPFANVSMVFKKGDKGERVEDVAIRGLFEEQHIVLHRTFWNRAFKARAPPVYLPYFLNGEQLQRYPECRRVWWCGRHTLFVPVIKNAEFSCLNVGDEWPTGCDVPTKYACDKVPCPCLYIKPKSANPILDAKDDLMHDIQKQSFI